VIFDVLGREVAVIYDGILDAGIERLLTIDGTGLPAGVYVLHVRGEDFADRRRRYSVSHRCPRLLALVRSGRRMAETTVHFIRRA
jgi:hypothetical protein